MIGVLPLMPGIKGKRILLNKIKDLVFSKKMGRLRNKINNAKALVSRQ